MSVSILHELADAVKNLVNGADFSPPLPQAVVTYNSDKPLEELKDLDVIVMPMGSTWNMQTRGAGGRDIAINIAIRKQVANIEDREAIDDLLALGEAVGDLLEDNTRLPLFSGGAAAVLVGVQMVLPYSAASLREKGLFICVVQGTYRVIRPRNT